MIECNKCNTWIHLSCAKIRKSHVPETYVCQSCRDTHGPPDARRSHRSRIGPRKHLLDWAQAELWTLTSPSPLHSCVPSTCWTDPSSNSGLAPFSSLSFMVRHEPTFFYKHFGGPIPSPYPNWKPFECYFRFTKVCFCFPTDFVRKAITEWMSVCRWHYHSSKPLLLGLMNTGNIWTAI